MPDNPQTAWFALIDHRLMALTGRDAVAFAHAQFMNDVAALRDGDWQWNGWLTPKGRVVALFSLLRIDAETLWLVLQADEAEALAAALRRFVFRSKVAIALPEDARIFGRLRASERASAAHWAGSREDGVELDLSGDGGGRALRIVFGDRAEAFGQSAEGEGP
nr:folate-binding protein [Xanthomonadaceae bacterium]